MTPEEKVWLVTTLADPTLRAILERLAPRSAELEGILRLARAIDRARPQQDAGDAPNPPATS